ncbi:hypothetical protein [Sphingobium ummariense]|uniref:hypothetical protein n=1 Tax=Sphingobium ummariense TaxID=420994 RepID=UPI0004CEB586|nr:hypothetical protein [Sphingobium ummariense]
MSASPTFELEPESPADRQARKEAQRRAAAKTNRKRREREAQQGLKVVTFTIPTNAIAAIDAFQDRMGLPNRSVAVGQLLKERFAADDFAEIRQELGL